MGDPEELMPAVLYLASNASGYTTGSDVLVDGAYSCL
jgi:sorbose reductase